MASVSKLGGEVERQMSFPCISKASRKSEEKRSSTATKCMKEINWEKIYDLLYY